jgi:dCMP deaminase
MAKEIFPIHTSRPSWDDYFFKLAEDVASRATCPRGKVGAVVVREKQIIATGYNGAPMDTPHCNEVGCLMYKFQNPDGTQDESCFRVVHAEANAIIQAARWGNRVDGGEMYVTHSPCIHCFKMVINANIQTVYYEKVYRLESIMPIAIACGVSVIARDTLRAMEEKEGKAHNAGKGK